MRGCGKATLEWSSEDLEPGIPLVLYPTQSATVGGPLTADRRLPVTDDPRVGMYMRLTLAIRHEPPIRLAFWDVFIFRTGLGGCVANPDNDWFITERISA
jgi:hypothetical protein